MLLRIAALVFALVPICASAAQSRLRVGSDISYAPLEFYGAHSRQVQGFDYDLAQALGASLGDRVAFENHDFNGLIPAVSRGEYDLVISAMSDTRARSKQVDFVDYFLAGSGMLVRGRQSAAHLQLGQLVRDDGRPRARHLAADGR